MNYLQQQLDARRNNQNLSYPKFAKASGIAQSTLYNLINGPMVHPPKMEQIEKMAKALDWPPIYLQQLVGEQFGYHVAEDRSAELQTVIASWEELSVRDRRTIARMVEELRRNHDHPT